MRCWQTPLVTVALACYSASMVTGFHDEEEEQQTFREVVQRLVRASRENLRPMKSFRINMHPSLEYWYEVVVMLPGAKTCRIYEHPKMVYRCEWTMPKSAAAETVYGHVVKAIEEALGPTDWRVRSAASGTRFEPVNPHRNPVWEIRKSGPAVEVLLFSVSRWAD
jgi:hypothetical protein